jgi:hypothetical protein
VASFSEDLAKALPFNSSLGLNWADAYIGKFFPSLPPHFGVGAAAGFTTMDSPGMRELASLLDTELPFGWDKAPLPAYTAEARIGGFFLPFDVGVKFGYLPPVEIFGIGTNYLLFGWDIRYAVLDKPILPRISVSIGLNYLEGGLSLDMGDAQELSYSGGILTLTDPTAEFTWTTCSLDAKVQISKSFLIVTPYLGLGASYAWSSAGYSIKADITDSSGAIDQDAINAILELAEVDTIVIDQDGISSIIDNSGFSFRVFGGLSFNLMVIKIDLTGLYNIRDNNFGGTIGIRFQL